MKFLNSAKNLEIFRVSPPTPVPPKLLERVSARAVELGFPAPSVEFISDAYSFLDGGTPIDPSQVDQLLRIKLRHSLPWYARPFSEAIRYCLPRMKERNERLLSFFRVATRDGLPGNTSEQETLALVALSHYVLEAAKTAEQSVSEIWEIVQEIVQLPRSLTSDERDLFESFPSLSQVEELPEALQQQFMASKTDPELFFLGDTLKIERSLGAAITEVRRSRRVHYGKSETMKDFSVRELLELERLLTERGKLILLRMYQRIKDYRCFSQIRMKKFKLDREGKEIRTRRMRGLSELHRVRQSELLLLQQHPTLFWLRMLQNLGTVRERGVKSVTKRLIYILIDRSLSMLFHGSMFKAGGVLFARLLAVTREDAVLQFRFFDGSVHAVTEARDPADAQMIMGMIRRTNFLGSGGTDLDGALRVGIRDVKRMCDEEQLERPQMLVVTDDKAEVTIVPEEFGGVELHAFICHGQNPSLKMLARSLGGVALEEL